MLYILPRWPPEAVVCDIGLLTWIKKKLIKIKQSGYMHMMMHKLLAMSSILKFYMNMFQCKSSNKSSNENIAVNIGY